MKLSTKKKTNEDSVRHPERKQKKLSKQLKKTKRREKETLPEGTNIEENLDLDGDDDDLDLDNIGPLSDGDENETLEREIPIEPIKKTFPTKPVKLTRKAGNGRYEAYCGPVKFNVQVSKKSKVNVTKEAISFRERVQNRHKRISAHELMGQRHKRRIMKIK